MTIDRALLICSICEFAFIAGSVGFTMYTAFQWITVTLILAKIAISSGEGAVRMLQYLKNRKSK